MYVIAHNGARIWGGAERATALILAGLQHRGHRVLLLCNAPLVADRARALRVPAELQPLGGDVAVHHAVALARRLRRERPDALLVGTFKKLWLAAPAARLAGVPRVVARIGLETDTPRSAKYRFVLGRWVDAVAVNAGHMAPPFLALPGWTPERVVTIHNGIQPSRRRLPAGAVRAALGLAPDTPVIGTVARLARQKRLDRLLRVLAALPARVHAVVAGEGEERAALTRLAGELGVGRRVHFLGHRDDVADVLGALDVYLVTSDREGMSNAMVEALAAGVPVVSTPVSGAAEALDPLGDGTAPGVVATFEVERLAAAVSRLLVDPALRHGMAAAARARAAERFSYERMIDRWEDLLAPARPSAREALRELEPSAW
ncbi:MAG TPA: glycosyltransferase family 4 protein [Longimicrobiales bacterium]|nr:glycosyltransferase family 4 protein [Longimicrobiales bacterium]